VEEFDREKAANLFEGVVYRCEVSGLTRGSVSMTCYIVFLNKEQGSEIIDRIGALKE